MGIFMFVLLGFMGGLINWSFTTIIKQDLKVEKLGWRVQIISAAAALMTAIFCLQTLVFLLAIL